MKILQGAIYITLQYSYLDCHLLHEFDIDEMRLQSIRPMQMYKQLTCTSSSLVPRNWGRCFQAMAKVNSFLLPVGFGRAIS